MTRREFAAQFRGALLNEAPSYGSREVISTSRRAKRRTRGIGYAGSVERAAQPARFTPPAEPEPAPLDLSPLLVKFQRYTR